MRRHGAEALWESSWHLKCTWLWGFLRTMYEIVCRRAIVDSKWFSDAPLPELPRLPFPACSHPPIHTASPQSSPPRPMLLFPLPGVPKLLRRSSLQCFLSSSPKPSAAAVPAAAAEGQGAAALLDSPKGNTRAFLEASGGF